MKITGYATCGHLITDDANEIRCKKSEVLKSLKVFDKTSDIPRVELKVGRRTIYLYNDKHSGYKRASDKPMTSVWEITEFACEKVKGKRRVQYYSSLYNSVMYYLNK